MSSNTQLAEAEKAEKMRLKDAEILARRKQKFDAARFAHIETTNKVHGKPKPHPQPSIEDSTKKNDTTKEKEKKKKGGWRIFKKKDKKSDVEMVKEATHATPSMAKSPPPIAARSIKPTNVPVEIAPNWASTDQQNQRPQPNMGHSSDVVYPRPNSAAGAPKHSKPSKPSNEPDGPMFATVGYGTTNRKPTSKLSGTIAAFQAGAPKAMTGKPRNMKKEKVSSSTSETMDNHGNIIRTITRTITDLNGKKRTEKEVIKVPAKR